MQYWCNVSNEDLHNRRVIEKIVGKLSETNSDVTINHLKTVKVLKLKASDFERRTMVFCSASYFFTYPVKTPKKETR